MPRIAEREWLDELKRLAAQSRKTADGLTVSEMVASTGMYRKQILSLLAVAKQRGMLVAMRKTTERVDGVPAVVPAYKVVLPKRR